MKPRLVYLSPVTPAPGGSGRAMRAAAAVDALARDYEVHLVIVPLDGPPDRRATEWSSRRARRVTVVPLGEPDLLSRLIASEPDPQLRREARLRYPRPMLCRFATRSTIEEVGRAVRAARASVLFVFRLYLAPYLPPFGGERPFTLLDVDDDDARTARSIARMLERRGDREAAAIERTEGAAYDALLERWLPWFDRVFAASPRDVDRLRRRYRAPAILHLPNVIRKVRPTPLPRTHRARPRAARILFVGSLGYAPNDDAARVLIETIVPRISRDVEVVIAGRGASADLVAFACSRGASVVGPVRSLAPVYRWCDLVCVPLSAGGGTRIKILEAFAHGRPVVSTTAGAEGLLVRSGEELLLADHPRDFARACLSVLAERQLAQGLVDRALAFVRSAHSPDTARAALARGLAP